MNHIYIYIYIYILSSTDRLFRCITTIRYDKTREMLQAGIETWLIDVRRIFYPKTIGPFSISEGILRIYLFTYTLIGYRSAQFIRRSLHLCSWSSRQFTTHVLNPRTWHRYIVIHRQTVLLYHNSSVWLDTGIDLALNNHEGGICH